jgi:uncharacterized protein (TIGR03067 family)
MIQEAIRTDQRRLQGTWRLTSGAVGGQSGGVKGKTRWIIDGNKIVMEMEERRDGKFTLDPAKSPRRIDIVTTSSDGKTTEEVHGVYEFLDDELHVCLASGDEPRPANVHSNPGSRQVSLVLRRERP